MPRVGFEPTISAGERPKTYALDRAATGTGKMQPYIISFITVNAVHVSGGFSTHHQGLKLYTQHLVYVKLACCYRQPE